MKKFFRWLGIILLTLILLLLGTLVTVSFLGITVNLDRVRPVVEKAATAALERQVAITGSVELLPTLSPRIEIQGLRIDNPESWVKTDFVTVKLVRMQLGLMDLFRKKIRIDEITAEGVTVYLESHKDDSNNWSFSAADEKTDIPAAESLTEEKNSGTMEFEAVETISLKSITVLYKDAVLDKTISFQLDELTGKVPAGESLVFHAKGNVQEQSYSFDLDAGALNTFRPRQQAWPLALSGNIAGTPFSAKGDIGYRNNEQQLALDVSVGAVDVGGLLSWLNVVKNVKASTEDLSLALHLKGESLHELLSQSEFVFKLQGGIWDLSDSSKEEEFLISGLEGSIVAKPDSPITIGLSGTVGATPVVFSLEGMPLVQYVTDPGELPVTISLSAAGAELDFSGGVDLPVNSKTFNLEMTLKGDKLDSLNEFLDISLPPFGPYSLKAQFAATETGYHLSDLGITVGSSDLSGSMHYNESGERPAVSVQLVSNLLQLDDFALGEWSPDGKDSSEKKKELPENKEAEKKETRTGDIPSLLSPKALARLNATLTIEMAKVLSGNDLLGSGSLQSTLQDGRFAINPLQLDLVNGTAELDFSFYPTETEAEIHLGTVIDRMDLGIISRRIKPEATMGGVLFLNIELDSTAPGLSDLMTHAQGHFDLGFAPVNFDASLVDLWAVNLLSALASEVDEEPSSTINCLVASFGMDDGFMQERALFLDTTHMSIEGEANINFKTREFKVKAAPKAKRPEFFSLATPVKVGGSFEDFKIGIKKLGLTTSLVSFITSPLHVPVRRLFVGERPQDGREACKTAWKNRNVEKKVEAGIGD